MEKTMNATFTDQLFFIASVLSLESRQLISRSGINQPFGFAPFVAAASINAGPLRVAFDGLKAFGWLSQSSGDEYFFNGRASAIGTLPTEVAELFSLLAPRRMPCAEDIPHLWRWLELSALDWNLLCPAFIRGLNELLSLVLLRRLQLNGAIDIDTGRVDPRRIDNGQTGPERIQLLSDFLRTQQWIRCEERQLVLHPERRTLINERLSEPFLAYYASLPATLDDLLFGKGERWAGVLQWLKGAAEQQVWPGDRPALEQLLGKVFDAQPLSAQPDWIVELGGHPGVALSELGQWVRHHTARGQALDSNPLQLLMLDDAVVSDPAALRQRLRNAGVGASARVLWLGIGQQNLQQPGTAPQQPALQVPQRYYLRCDGQAAEGASVLGSLQTSAKALAALIGEQSIVLSESHWRPDGPQADHFACHYPVEAAHYLMALAGAGLFADPGMLHRLPLDGIDCAATSGCYRAREYRVRHVTLADMPALLTLEQACWPEGGRVDEHILRRRLNQDPAGQLALELKGEVVGVIYSQRITRIEGLFAVNFATVDQLFHGNGSTLQIQSLNILPTHQYSGYGDQLLEFMLQYCTLLNGVDTVVGVTRCKDYPKYRDIAQADYIHSRDERGVLLDPVLRFHELHGAQIERLVPGYRPADADNAGHGVLVRYDLACRQRQEIQLATVMVDQPAISIDDAVRQGVNRCLGQAQGSRVSPRHSLMELGLDSADLLALSEQLGMTFGLSLEPSFFFRYNSVEKIVAALQERLGTQVPPSKETQAALAQKPPSTLAVADDDFAVIGISGCFPGGELEGFWAAVRSGVSQIRDVPPERATAGPAGGYIDGIECFDHWFFGVSAAEAALMDPQQRLLLQHAWWALDDAAIAAAAFARRETGVFVAAAPSEYREVVEVPRDSPYLLTSSSPCMYANRISWFLDLRGPSEYCNTACSSVLVALHRAMQSIRAGECRQALVGAVNLLLSPDETAGYRQMGFLSEQPHTRSFQAEADGYVRAEGVGVLLLKPLADALRDGDRIHLKIKGSGVGHGGRGISLTAPDHASMQAAMVAAYRSAGVAPHTVSYVEAHGTGSAMGDAIEIDAIQAARVQLSGGDQLGAAWNISTLKPLIGHCELASGMAALFKVIDAVKQRQLPGIAGYQQLNPAITLDPQQLSLSSGNRPWPALKDIDGHEMPRRASINSYGFGGVNAHLVVEEHNARHRVAAGDSEPQLILLSARDVDRLKEQAARLNRAISQRSDLCLADIACTLQVGRTAMACRWACVVDSIKSLQQQLDALARGLSDNVSLVDEQATAIGETVTQALLERDLLALADYWRQGIEPDWRKLPHLGEPQRIGLPGYAFARERHWLAPRRVETTTQASECETPSQKSVRQMLAELLGCDPQTLAGCESRSLASLGLSSLGAVALKARLEQHLQLSVSLAQLSPYLSLGSVETCLAALKRQGDDQLVPVLQVAPDARHQPFALNDIQQSFLSGRRLLAESERVGCHIYLEFDWPELDVYRLNQAWNRLMFRHDALRLRLLNDGRQQVGELPPYRFKTHDFRRSEPTDREQSLAALRTSMSHKVYLSGQETLFEIVVSLLDHQVSRVHLSIDELIVDATSLEVLLQQWLMIYQESATELPAQGVSLRDYQLSLEAFKQSPRYQRDLQYWVDKLAQAPTGLSLPKASRPAGRERRRLTSTLEQSCWQRLKARGDALQVSGTALLLSLFGLILQQANAGKAFSLISTSYGRLPVHPDIDRLVGPLISTQFFVFAGAAEQTLAELAQQVQRQLLADLDHASVSGISALREVRQRGDKSKLFNGGEVVFTSMLNNPVIDGAPSFGDAQHYCVTQTPQINLDHQLRERGGALSFSWDVAIDCYPVGMIDQLFGNYCQLLVTLANGDNDWWALKTSTLVHVAPFELAPGAPPKIPFALTDQQQAYAFNRSLHRGQGSSHLYMAVAIEALDIARLEKAWQQLVAHHPMLRTRILPNGTQQILEAPLLMKLETVEKNISGSRIVEEMLGRVTALGEWPYAELRVSTLDEQRSLVHLAVDLLLVDLPSRDLLIHQLLNLYHGLPQTPLVINFGSYMEALGQYNRTPAAQNAALYWQEKFRLLPQGPQVNDERDINGLYLEYEHYLDCWPALRDRIARTGISADAVLISAYAWSIAKHCAQPAFTLVAPGWKRPAVHPQIDALVGDFTTLSWIDFNNEPMTFIEQARRCERIFTEDQQHSMTNGLQALRKVATDKQRPRKLDFPVVFTRLNPQGPLDLPEGVTLVKSTSRTHGVALDNLSIEQAEGLLIHWDLAANRLTPTLVDAMFADYCRLLEGLAADEGAWGLGE
ncbi:condensation domain-containing protein [Pseudomonas sp. B21-015]|uniref:beta-ketoacyl synthase N-terminal-like domain-containing protein n=1 Tax=Pseudomonas sp. B21-015 TaxID=2895473 RepID=UPI00215E92A1|nr:beta-ketoacyl synthase N-terminal-like domain-containing protein [Pseudomonas sp. B21-015]UVM52819.1 condensation domain-containing protein [Pseudomonas sp. B21-015]